MIDFQYPLDGAAPFMLQNFKTINQLLIKQAAPSSKKWKSLIKQNVRPGLRKKMLRKLSYDMNWDWSLVLKFSSIKVAAPSSEFSKSITK